MAASALDEALVTIMYAAATVDGALNDIERDELLALERRSKRLRALGADSMKDLNRRAVERVRYGDASISVSPDSFLAVKQNVAAAERRN